MITKVKIKKGIKEKTKFCELLAEIEKFKKECDTQNQRNSKAGNCIEKNDFFLVLQHKFKKGVICNEYYHIVYDTLGKKYITVTKKGMQFFNNGEKPMKKVTYYIRHTKEKDK